jgi:hypothetical protein
VICVQAPLVLAIGLTLATRHLGGSPNGWRPI